MSSDKTKAELAAEEYAVECVSEAAAIGGVELPDRDVKRLIHFSREGFLAGRAHFIEHELRGLLMQAREYRHTIDELIEMARKG